MDETLFDELLRSIEQMEGIVRGDYPPSRTFDVELPVNGTVPHDPRP